jgi:probable HAF family extracellular repeat protein
MKPCGLATVCLLLVLLGPNMLSGQQQISTHSRSGPHSRYRFVDLGTLGGPVSYPTASGESNLSLNNAGEIGGYADISTPDPLSPNCFNTDCFLSHTFRWKDGRLKDLGGLPGNHPSAASGINAAGWIAGFSQSDEIDPVTGFPATRAVLWKHRHPIDLGTLSGGNESISVFINDGAQVIGISTNGIPDPYSFFGTFDQNRTFIWEKGVMRDIGTLGGPDALPSGSCEISRTDFVAGQSYTSFTPNSTNGFLDVAPFVWNRGTMTNLGSLGGTYGYGECANDREQVIGQSNLTGDTEQHAFLWERGNMKDLGTLGGTFSRAIWLNRSGVVVGGATTTNDESFHAALWKRGAIVDLGTLPAYDCSVAGARNSKGQIVGSSFDCATGLEHAFIWEKGGPMVDLNSFIPANSSLELAQAFNINERGEILGYGVPPGSPTDDASLGFVGRLFLLIPCDEAQSSKSHDCDASLQSGYDTQGNADVAKMATSASKGLTPETFAALRTRLTHSYRALGNRNLKPARP